MGTKRINSADKKTGIGLSGSINIPEARLSQLQDEVMVVAARLNGWGHPQLTDEDIEEAMEGACDEADEGSYNVDLNRLELLLREKAIERAKKYLEGLFSRVADLVDKAVTVENDSGGT